MTSRACALLALITLSFATACETTYGFEEVEVGGDETGRAPREQSNSQFVRAVYADLLGRAPEIYDFIVTVDGQEVSRFPVDESQFLLASLDGIGDPAPVRGLIATGLAASPEAGIPAKEDIADPAGFIAEQFRRFLGREPGAYELSAFVDEWESDPAVNPQTVIRALIASREYQTY